MNAGSYFTAIQIHGGILFYNSTHLTGSKTHPVLLRFVQFLCLLMLTILFPFVGPGASRAFYVQLCCVRPDVADGLCLLSSPVACGSMCACHIANIAGKYLSSRASVSIAFNTPAGPISIYRVGDYESSGRSRRLPDSCAPTAPHAFMLSGASQVSRLMRGNGPGFCGSDMPASGGAGRPSSSIHGTSANRAYVF